jgi:hypothetical protein
VNEKQEDTQFTTDLLIIVYASITVWHIVGTEARRIVISALPKGVRKISFETSE